MNRTTSLVLLVVLFGSARLWRGIARNNPVMPGFGIGASRNASATPKAYHLRGPVAGPVRTEHDEYPHLFGSAPAIPARRGHRDGGVGGVDPTPRRGGWGSNHSPQRSLSVRRPVAISAPIVGPKPLTFCTFSKRAALVLETPRAALTTITDTTCEMADAKLQARRANVAPCCAEETWKAVPGYEGRYEVSNCGRVRSVPRVIVKHGTDTWLRGRVLAIRINHNGYVRLQLIDAEGRRRAWRAHHLVALAFVGSCPGEIGSRIGQWTVHHKDDDRTNNHASNLEWLLHTANVSVSQHGGKRSETGAGFTHGHAEAARCILEAGLRSPEEVAAMFGVTKQEVLSCLD